MNRFFTDKENINENRIIIKGKDFNHIKNVLRMARGEKLEISSHEDIYLGEIENFSEDAVVINILEKEESSKSESIEISLFQALAKGSKMDLIIQKGTEIGVTNFYGVLTHRTIVKINDEKKEKNKLKRWSSIAEEAAKQSKRSKVPKVKEIMTFKNMINFLGDQNTIIVPYEDEENISIGQVLKELKKTHEKNINLIIGPEGGFEEKEIEEIKRIGGRVVTLGDKILRTETAGFVASTIILYELSGLGVI